MDAVGALIFFAVVGAVICAKARVAGGAIVFALIAIVLFISTPTGAGLPGALSDFLDTINGASSPVLNGDQPGGVG